MRVRVMVDEHGVEEVLRAISPARPLRRPENTKTYVVVELSEEKIVELRQRDFVVREDLKYDLEVG